MKMAKVVETSGVDADEAIARALSQIGLTRDQVDVDVVREGKRGFLGIGTEDAIVRVTAKGSASSTPGERSDHDQSRNRRGRRRPDQRRAANQRDDSPDRQSQPQTQLTPESTNIPGVPSDPPTAPPVDIEDEIDFSGHVLRDILTLLGLTDTEISARDAETAGDGEGLTAQVFDINSLEDDSDTDLGPLIGRRGETIAALQSLLNVMVSTRYEGQHFFSVDVERYRSRREQSLIELAHRVASDVRSTGDVITLEPMTPAERRIVHLELQDEDGVKTESIGHGNRRQIEILPE